MKHKYLLLALPLLICTSCNKNNIPTINCATNLEASVQPFLILNDEQLIKYNSHKQSFALFVGNSNCSICEQIKEKIVSYIQNNNCEFYQYYLSNRWEKEISKLEIFKDINSTPSILVIKNGESIYSISGKDLENDNNYERMFSTYLNISNNYLIINEVSTLINIKATSIDFLAFTYYKSDDYVYPYLSALQQVCYSSNKLTLLLENAYLKDKQEIFKLLGIDQIESEYTCVIFTNGHIKTINTYLSDTDGFNQILTSYYC